MRFQWAHWEIVIVDKHVKTLLQELARTCPASELQREDWDKLYEMCLYAHLNSLPFTPGRVRLFLHEHGCSIQRQRFSVITSNI